MGWLLIALSPLSLILVLYAVAGWVDAPLGRGDGADANLLGRPLHVAGPAAVDRWAFGEVPSVWLQQHLVTGSPHWYDAVAALVYVTHFVAIPLVTGVLWFRRRDCFTTWLVALLSFTAIGVVGYVVYPAAPPWLASSRGVVGPVERLSGAGWDYLHLPALADLVGSGQAGSNPVAAMPSLHAGTALLVTLVVWPLVHRGARAVLSAYVLLMAVALVYTGEHYVVDVVAGWLTAGAGVGLAALAALVRRRRDHCVRLRIAAVPGIIRP